MKATTAPGTIVHTGGWSSYTDLSALGFQHRPRSQSAAPIGEQLLPRAHRAVPNFKAWMNSTHRKSSVEHLSAYVNEFTFRHNRRGNPHAALQTRLGLSNRHDPVKYRQISDRAA